MEEYKLTLGMEPTDDYKKAKQDLIQAMRSIQKLSPQQQQMLAEELFGAANVMVLSQIDVEKTFSKNVSRNGFKC